LIKAVMSAYRREQWLLTRELAEKLLAEEPAALFAIVVLGEAQSVLGDPRATRTLRKAVQLAAPEQRRLALTTLGSHYERGMKPVLARRAYLQAIAESTDDATPYIYLGALESTLGRLDEARVAFEAATRCKRGAIDEAWYNLATVSARQGRMREAEREVRKALKISPDYKLANRLAKELKLLRNAQ
jgi:Tfp pilus assembly protein PilF